MKIRVFPALVISVALSCTAGAADAIDPVALGNFDAMLATCGEVNPAGKAAYDSMRETMIGEQPEGVLAAVVKSPEYKQAFDLAREQAKTEPADAAAKGCAQLAASLGPHARSAPRSAVRARKPTSPKSPSNATTAKPK